MEMISRLADASRVKFFKRMIAARAKPNYHFIPEWVLEQHLEMGDPVIILSFLLKAEWGNWCAKPKETLVQRFEYDNKRVKYQIVLEKDDIGACTIYMAASHVTVFPRTTHVYVATDAYYRVLCNFDNEPLYEFNNPMYRHTGGDVKWQDDIAKVSVI